MNQWACAYPVTRHDFFLLHRILLQWHLPVLPLFCAILPRGVIVFLFHSATFCSQEYLSNVKQLRQYLHCPLLLSSWHPCYAFHLVVPSILKEFLLLPVPCHNVFQLLYRNHRSVLPVLILISGFQFFL